MDHIIQFENFSWEDRSKENRIIQDILNIASDKGYEADILSFSFSQMGIWLCNRVRSIEDVADTLDDSKDTFENVLSRLDDIIEVESYDLVKWNNRDGDMSIYVTGRDALGNERKFSKMHRISPSGTSGNMSAIIRDMRKSPFNCGVRLYFNYQK